MGHQQTRFWIFAGNAKRTDMRAPRVERRVASVREVVRFGLVFYGYERQTTPQVDRGRAYVCVFLLFFISLFHAQIAPPSYRRTRRRLHGANICGAVEGIRQTTMPKRRSDHGFGVALVRRSRSTSEGGVWLV
jgi:hypothetical protein